MVKCGLLLLSLAALAPPGISLKTKSKQSMELKEWTPHDIFDGHPEEEMRNGKNHIQSGRGDLHNGITMLRTSNAVSKSITKQEADKISHLRNANMSLDAKTVDSLLNLAGQLVQEKGKLEDQMEAGISTVDAGSNKLSLGLLETNDATKPMLRNSSSESETCWLTAKSSGGFGHILKSMITTMGLHGMPLPREDPSATRGILEYDATSPREYHFDGHYKGKEREDVEAFFDKVNQNFKEKQCKELSCSPDAHRMEQIGDVSIRNIGVHQLEHCESDVTYQANTLTYAGKHDETSLLANIHNRVGVITELLPNHDLPKEGKTVVMHVRLADSSRRGKEPAKRVTDPLELAKVGEKPSFELELQSALNNVLNEIEKNKGYDHLIVHTDDAVNVHHYLKGRKPDQIFGGETQLPFVLSQMVHADTLIASDSALSLSAAFLRDGLGHKEDSTFVPQSRKGQLLPPVKWY